MWFHSIIQICCFNKLPYCATKSYNMYNWKHGTRPSWHSYWDPSSRLYSSIHCACFAKLLYKLRHDILYEHDCKYIWWLYMHLTNTHTHTHTYRCELMNAPIFNYCVSLLQRTTNKQLLISGNCITERWLTYHKSFIVNCIVAISSAGMQACTLHSTLTVTVSRQFHELSVPTSNIDYILTRQMHLLLQVQDSQTTSFSQYYY